MQRMKQTGSSRMKSVLISIKPKYCMSIASGQKTVEIRKTRPKIDTPFKCYIYCTQGNLSYFTPAGTLKKGNGKVIGEFVCDTYIIDKTFGHDELLNASACLTVAEAAAYCANNITYGWHISDLVMYDEPKDLSEFRGHNSECMWQAIRENGCKDLDGNECRDCHLHRPPQSWCYVEAPI